MTLPLKDITTAPRDGTKIWAMHAGTLVPVEWDACGEDSCWSEFGQHAYDDDDFSGWLDIEALVRDSERLNHILRNQGQCEIQPQPWIKDVFDATCETCPSNITQWEQAWLEKARAAIDKEMDNGA